MFHKAIDTTPAQSRGLLEAAAAAARAIPPAFPLSATVAVNPFLGQSGEDLATASARLRRVAGVRLTRDRAELVAEIGSGRIADEDLAEALRSSTSVLKPADLGGLKARLTVETPVARAVPTVAELARNASGTDWPAVIARTLGLWAAGHFDRGQGLWSQGPGRGAFAAWRDWATHDMAPEIAGLTGFCAFVRDVPDIAEQAILRAAGRLGLTEAAGPTAFHRLLMDLGGWAQHGRWVSWLAEMQGRGDPTVLDLLAIRLVWEEALFLRLPEVAGPWAEAVAAHAAPVLPTGEDVVDAILQEASERAHQRRLGQMLLGAEPRAARPVLQAAFCIDVRSEVFRRALERLDPGIETIGFAGFFGLPLAYRGHGTDEAVPHLPVLLNSSLNVSSLASPEAEQASRIAARAARAWDRFRQAAVSSFAFVEAAGPFYGAKLLTDTLGLRSAREPIRRPGFDTGLPAEAKAGLAASILKAMSLTRGHARLVLLLGHGARTENNPHESGYHCGACGGQTGEVSARVLADLLNDPETRAGLAAHGIDLPEDTLFLAGLHVTTTDMIELFEDQAAPDHARDIRVARTWLTEAGQLARGERASRLPGATAGTIAARALNWAEVRPEWGLAGCAAFIAAPRAVTAGVDLAGRAFLHSYDWRADRGFSTLELILTAPVVVASWISLQYYGSTVAPAAFGGGNKLIHNVTGGIGVVEGNGGLLRAGLPWQAVHDGTGIVHEPLRLTVLIEAPVEAMTEILGRHPGVRDLFDNGWLHLLALEEGRIAARYRAGGRWEGA